MTFKNPIIVLHYRTEPVGSGDDLIGANLTVTVIVNQIKSTLIQLETFDRTTQHCP